MKSPIHAIPQLYRNLRRWTEILSILSKYGLADWISRLNIEFVKDSLKSKQGESLARQSHEARVRLALSELGPTFIKLGQMLSTRPDVVGAELAAELCELQDNVPSESFEIIKETVESELGQRIDEIFSYFDSVPTATASIGQVHRATLKSGGEVAVKVQRKGVSQKIIGDLEILSGLSQLAEKIDELKIFRPRQTVAELTRSLKRELDFGREERNLHQFFVKFENHKLADVPAPITDLSTSRVLTMEFMEGRRLTDLGGLLSDGVDLERVTDDLVSLNLEMIFDDGFYHGDPHPGNILVQDSGRLALLDFGMVGRIGEGTREDIEEMLFSVFNNDVTMLSAAVGRLCEAPPQLDEARLENDLSDFVGQYSTRAITDYQIGEVLNSMFEIIRRNDLRLPHEAILLLRVLITVEGAARTLNPKFQIIKVLKPLHRKLFLRRLSPARQYRKFRRMGMQIEKLAETMPKKISNVIDQIRLGKIDINLDHRRLGSSVNRLVYGMLTSALFLGAALMLATKVPPLLFSEKAVWGMEKLSLLGLFCLFGSFLLGCRLLWAIMNSGSLNRRE